jgi:endonuclease III-like uncharacterized protein
LKSLQNSIIKPTNTSNFIRKLMKKNDRENKEWLKIYNPSLVEHSRDHSRESVFLTDFGEKRKLSEHGNSFV